MRRLSRHTIPCRARCTRTRPARPRSESPREWCRDCLAEPLSPTRSETRASPSSADPRASPVPASTRVWRSCLHLQALPLAWSNNRSSEPFPGESVEEDRYCHGEAFAALPRPAGENKLALVSEEFLLIDCGFEA